MKNLFPFGTAKLEFIHHRINLGIKTNEFYKPFVKSVFNNSLSYNNLKK